MVGLAAKAGAEQRSWMIRGIAEAVAGWHKARAPKGWKALEMAAQSDEAETQARVRELSVLFGDGRALDGLEKLARDRAEEGVQRVKALQNLIAAQPEGLRAICEPLLEDRVVSAAAVRGLALFDEPEVAALLLGKWGKFDEAGKATVVEVLVSRPAWAESLVDAMEKGRVPKAAVSAFQARQIAAHGVASLSARLEAVWGVAKTSSAEKQALMEQLRAALAPERLAGGDLKRGREVYRAVCQGCHVLHGEGGKLGPDLTGSGRAQLDYLLENVVDPSAVVGADYRLQVVTMKDGRVLSGVIAAQTERTLTLGMVGQETTVEKSEIASQAALEVSLMPEGLLGALTPEQVVDLIAFLMRS